VRLRSIATRIRRRRSARLGLTQKLDYLNDGDPSTTQDLGITGLWLMPIHPSPSYHGYDVTDYRGINPDYGTMADFEAFLDSAHARGIRVIIDLVINHSSAQHPWFVDARSGPNATYRDWYRWTSSQPGYQGPWGQNVWHNSSSGFYYGVFWDQMPDLNYEHPAVRQEIFDLADYWLGEVGIDGFRIDAVKFLYEDGAQLENLPATFEFFRDFRQHYQAIKPEAFAVGEAWTSTAQVLDYVREDRLDYCFEFDLAGQMLYAVQSGDAANLRNQLNYVYHSYPYLQWGSFLTNHDQDRVIDVLGNDLAQNKVAASLYLTLPGVPYLYYGEEVGMNGTKPDPDIRRPMQWDTDPASGFTSGSPWRSLNGNYLTRNVATMQQQSNSLWHHYRSLIDLRHQSAALRRGYLETPVSNQSSAFAALRYWEDDTVLVLVNLSDEMSGPLTLSSLGLAPGSKVAFDGLSGDTRTLSVSGGELSHPPLSGYETRVYRLDGTFAVSVPTQKTPAAWQVYPNPSRGEIILVWSQAQAGPMHYRLLDLQGRVLRQDSLPGARSPLSLTFPRVSAGVYLLQIEQGDTRHQVKVWLQ
jgi:alpha-amylase